MTHITTGMTAQDNSEHTIISHTVILVHSKYSSYLPLMGVGTTNIAGRVDSTRPSTVEGLRFRAGGLLRGEVRITQGRRGRARKGTLES
jgi:hypothetical protein